MTAQLTLLPLSLLGGKKVMHHTRIEFIRGNCPGSCFFGHNEVYFVRLKLSNQTTIRVVPIYFVAGQLCKMVKIRIPHHFDLARARFTGSHLYDREFLLLHDTSYPYSTWMIFL